MNRKIEQRKCAVCNKKFTPKVANSRYCSEKCYKAAKAKRDKASKKSRVESAKKSGGAKKCAKAVLTQKIKLAKAPSKMPVVKTKVNFVKLNDYQALAIAVRVAFMAIRRILKGK